MEELLNNRIYVSLTDREKEVLTGVCDALTYKEIGELLFISTRTVEHHMYRIFIKIDCNNKIEVVKYAIKNELYKLC
tara:strand:- start:176 stop:406 length:231 start_codon:yes stop_codon:yes gene_type:complete